MSESPRVIVFFDGDCLFCSKGVHILHELDPHDRLRFASLQGKTARPFVDILPALGEKGDASMATMVIAEGKSEVFTHSAGVVQALRATGGMGQFLGICLRLVPAFLRDRAYRILAGNRDRFFGKGDVCEIMRPALKNKLLG